MNTCIRRKTYRAIPLSVICAFLLLTSCSKDGLSRSEVAVCGDDSALKHAAVADFNGDGKTDLAVACASKHGWTGYVEVFAGKGDGGFSDPHKIAFPDSEPRAVAAMRAPKGKARGLFVASTDSGMRYLSSISNSAGMAFGTPNQVYANGLEITQFTVTDVNGDGNDDFVFPMDGFWLQSSGGGAVPQSVIRQRLNKHGFAHDEWGDIGDFNADGTADAAFRLLRSGHIQIYTGEGTMRVFTLGKSVRNVGSVLGVTDFNGDGADDLLVRMYGPRSEAKTEIALSQSSGRWTFSDPVEGLTGATQILVTDVTGDGNRDLVAERYRPDAKKGEHALFVAVGKGDGTFAAARSVPIAVYPMTLLTADVTGDGKPDILYGDHKNNVMHILSGSLGAS